MIGVFPEGVSLTASGVVSPDGRFARLSLFPTFSFLGPVYTFTYYPGYPYYYPPLYSGGAWGVLLRQLLPLLSPGLSRMLVPALLHGFRLLARGRSLTLTAGTTGYGRVTDLDLSRCSLREQNDVGRDSSEEEDAPFAERKATTVRSANRTFVSLSERRQSYPAREPWRVHFQNDLSCSLPRIAAMAIGLATCLGVGAANVGAAEDVAASREQIFQQQVRPLLAKYCYDCHGNGAAVGDVRLDEFETSLQAQKARTTWLRVRQKIDNGEMPPADADQPTADERQAVSSLIDQVLNAVDCEKEARPGRVTIRRLNRVEYRNTIRDLLGIDYAPAADFPADDVGYGFDNMADVLSLPPILLEKYLAAAEDITARAIANESPPQLLSVQPGPEVSAEEAARQVLERVATRAYRRPVTAEELERLLQLVRSAREQGEPFETCVQVAVEAILVSPHFLFRVERDPEPGQAERRLDDFELATRLAYFLWSSMPDEELFALARQGGLSDSETLQRQVQRMLRIAPLAGSGRQLCRAVVGAAEVRRRPGQRAGFSRFRRTIAGRHAAGDGAVFRAHPARGSRHLRVAYRRLHVPERAAGPALRHLGGERRVSSASYRPPARRAAA